MSPKPKQNAERGLVESVTRSKMGKEDKTTRSQNASWSAEAPIRPDDDGEA